MRSINQPVPPRHQGGVPVIKKLIPVGDIRIPRDTVSPRDMVSPMQKIADKVVALEMKSGVVSERGNETMRTTVTSNPAQPLVKTNATAKKYKEVTDKVGDVGLKGITPPSV